MNKWIDDNTNFDNLAVETVFKKKRPVAKCCSNPDFHVYGYVHSPNRGSLWAWCSNCKRFVHLDGIRFPNDFKNADGIELKHLCAIPEYLEENKQIADKQLEAYLAS